MSEVKIFDSETVVPDDELSAMERTLLGFEKRYGRVRDQLRLLLSMDELGAWNQKHHGGKLALCAHPSIILITLRGHWINSA
jgi:hypothetical protein